MTDTTNKEIILDLQAYLNLTISKMSIDDLIKLNPDLQTGVSTLIGGLQGRLTYTEALYEWDQIRSKK